MLGEMCSENLSKIHSEACQKSNTQFLAKMVNGQKLLTIFEKSFNLDASQGSEDASDGQSTETSHQVFICSKLAQQLQTETPISVSSGLNCLEYERVNRSWFVVIDLEEIMFSAST